MRGPRTVAVLALSLVVGLGGTAGAVDDPATPAPGIVQGSDGELFFGPSFDQFCTDGATGFDHRMRQLSRLALVIRRSGRRVVFSIAPDKSHVRAESLPRSAIPHGRCARIGARAHRKALDGWKDPSHLPVRVALADDRRRVFWRTDPHWTRVGAEVYATALATKLDPELGARLRFVKGRPDTRLWPMAAQLGLPAETAPTSRPAGGVGHRAPGTPRRHRLRDPDRPLVALAAHDPDLAGEDPDPR